MVRCSSTLSVKFESRCVAATHSSNACPWSIPCVKAKRRVDDTSKPTVADMTNELKINIRTCSVESRYNIGNARASGASEQDVLITAQNACQRHLTVELKPLNPGTERLARLSPDQGGGGG